MMSIGECIRNLRKKAGFTQKQLAEKVGVNEVTIRSYEAEKYNPKMNTLAKLCVALDCKITDLIDEDSQKYYRIFDYTAESEQQQKEAAARKAPKFTDKAETTKKTSQLFTRNKKENITKDGKPPKFTTYSTTYAPQEAYELLHSLIDDEGIDDREREEVSQQLKKILGSYKGLNEIGRKKAVERIEELYMIPKYIFDNFPDKID